MRSLRKCLQYAYDLAATKVAEAQETRKAYYDMKSRGAVVRIGDRVLVRNVAFKGKHKLADRFQEEVYEVLEQPNPDIPVYRVRSEGKTGQGIWRHRNLLLPISAIPPESSRADVVRTVPVPRPRKLRVTRAPVEKRMSEGADESDLEEVDTPVLVPPSRPVPTPRQRPVPTPRQRPVPTPRQRPVPTPRQRPVPNHPRTLRHGMNEERPTGGHSLHSLSQWIPRGNRSQWWMNNSRQMQVV